MVKVDDIDIRALYYAAKNYYGLGSRQDDNATMEALCSKDSGAPCQAVRKMAGFSYSNVDVDPMWYSALGISQKPPERGTPETFVENYENYKITSVGGYYHAYRPDGTGIGLFPSLPGAKLGIDADLTSIERQIQYEQEQLQKQQEAEQQQQITECKWGDEYPRLPFGGCDEGYTKTGIAMCKCNQKIIAEGGTPGDNKPGNLSEFNLDDLMKILPSLIILMVLVNLIGGFRK